MHDESVFLAKLIPSNCFTSQNIGVSMSNALIVVRFCNKPSIIHLNSGNNQNATTNSLSDHNYVLNRTLSSTNSQDTEMPSSNSSSSSHDQDKTSNTYGFETMVPTTEV